MAKKELKGNRFFDIFFSGLHVIAVDRHNSDMEAMRACMRLLKKGEILGIFPEGTRHAGGNMQKLESGAALIALRANVPLIPVYVKPKFRVFRKADCYVGKPIDFSDLREEGINKDTCEALQDRIRNLYANWPED